MKMTLKVTVEMTPEQVAEYCDRAGIAGIDRPGLREDVRRYVASALQGSPDLNVGDCTEGITVR